jgi:hypothetical protein
MLATLASRSSTEIFDRLAAMRTVKAANQVYNGSGRRPSQLYPGLHPLPPVPLAREDPLEGVVFP